MKRIVVSLAIAAALLASQAASASQAGPAQASGAKTVDISHFEFHPPALDVAKGTRVVFSNSSGTAHTATDKGAFDTGRIKAGSSVAVRFTQKGTFSYHCTIHPFMHGKIVVG
jgi:plastocyanin